MLVSAATVALALHVAVDSFIAPEPGTAAADHVLRGAASVAVLAPRGRRLPASSRRRPSCARLGAWCAGARRSRACRRGCPGSRCPGEDWTGFAPLPARRPARRGAPPLSSGARARQAGFATCVEPESRSQRVPGGLLGSSSRSRSAILRRHPPPPPPACGCRAGRLGRPYEELTIRNRRRPRPHGLVRAFAERCRCHLVSDARGEAAAGPDARPPRLRRAPAGCTAARRQRGRPQPLRLGGARDIDAAVAWLQARPDVTGGRIGGIGFSVGGEAMLRPPPPIWGSAPSLGGRGALVARTCRAGREVGWRFPRSAGADSGGSGPERYASATLAGRISPRACPRVRSSSSMQVAVAAARG